jgi:hypothetical protein
MGLADGVATQLVNSVVAPQKQLKAGGAELGCQPRVGESLRRLPRSGGVGSPTGADLGGVDPLVVECLQCRTTRVARRDRFNHFESPECPECGYLGWTPVLEVAEPERGAPRERVRAERRLPSVA